MSGHSKWKTIAHKKGAADAKRGKIFSRISKEIIVASKHGGGNPDTNLTLRSLISKARTANMPIDNIERSIKRGTGELAGAAALEEIVYEGYAKDGVGLIVVALTDNKNRAAAEIRHIFTKNGSGFAGQGAVTRGFKRKGQLFVEASAIDEDKLMELVLEAGAEDMKQDDSQFEILTEPEVFPHVVEALEKAEIPTVEAEVTLVPDACVSISDKTTASSVLKFVDDLEENEDVQNVYTNMEISDDVMKLLEADEG